MLNAFNDPLCLKYAGIIGGSLSPICLYIYFQGMILLYLAASLLVTPKLFLHDIYAYYTSLKFIIIIVLQLINITCCLLNGCILVIHQNH